MVYDFGRYSVLIKPLKSCISPRSANKNILPNILPICNASRCGQEACEEPLKCHNFVTLDSANQSARFHVPLQESAVGFSILVSKGAQSPKSYFGGFFCARLVWLLYTAGRMGAPSGAPDSFGRYANPVRSVSSFSIKDGGKLTSKESAMLKLFKAIGGMNIVPPISVFVRFSAPSFFAPGRAQ